MLVRLTLVLQHMLASSPIILPSSLRIMHLSVCITESIIVVLVGESSDELYMRSCRCIPARSVGNAWRVLLLVVATTSLDNQNGKTPYSTGRTNFLFGSRLARLFRDYTGRDYPFKPCTVVPCRYDQLVLSRHGLEPMFSLYHTLSRPQTNVFAGFHYCSFCLKFLYEYYWELTSSPVRVNFLHIQPYERSTDDKYDDTECSTILERSPL